MSSCWGIWYWCWRCWVCPTPGRDGSGSSWRRARSLTSRYRPAHPLDTLDTYRSFRVVDTWEWCSFQTVPHTYKFWIWEQSRDRFSLWSSSQNRTASQFHLWWVKCSKLLHLGAWYPINAFMLALELHLLIFLGSGARSVLDFPLSSSKAADRIRCGGSTPSECMLRDNHPVGFSGSHNSQLYEHNAIVPSWSIPHDSTFPSAKGSDRSVSSSQTPCVFQYPQPN